MTLKTLFASLLLILAFHVHAEIKLPSIFGDHMVLQRDQSNPVWGWAEPGEEVKIQIHHQVHSAVADEKGRWDIKLRPIPVGGPYQMHVEGEMSSFIIDDILVGEVWICSGQSNMSWTVNNSNHAELEILTANYPNIRLITVPRVGTQEAQKDFEGLWTSCTPQAVPDFSAIGYFFGRRLHQALDIPIGLIDNAWGGSAAEAWIRRDILENNDKYDGLLSWWEEQEASYDYDAVLEQWKGEVEAWKSSGQQGYMPRRPGNIMGGNHRPANIYNGVLHPTIGFGIRGVIWYQGESNASRAHQYRDLFPLMISHWRDEWDQGDFPFYFVQLADFKDESSEPGNSDWAELREAQTMTLDRLSNVGQAVIIDAGESRDIHPRNKQVVANRLARLALANDYGMDIQSSSPRYRTMEIKGGKAILTFDHVGSGLYAFDTREPLGFAIAGEDQRFVWAEAKIVGKDQIEVWAEGVAAPESVRYGWSDNPVCNMYSRDGLPLTPFRTDEWPGITEGVHHR